MKIFIGASVSEDIDEKYIKQGKKLVDLIVENNYDVVCCADLRGIIGNLYKRIKEKNKANIILTLPKIYLKYSKDIEDKIDILTETINERTEKSIKEADVCLFLPGGIGTTYEILSSIETKRAGEHSKEIIIVNSFGYYDDFLKMIDNMCDKRFAKVEDKDTYKVVNTVEEAIEIIKKM